MTGHPMPAQDFTQLLVWQKAHQVRLAVYEVTDKLPLSRKFKLIEQMQAAAQSVPGNIAEGFGRRQRRDKARFYTIAKGSADELKDQLIFVRERGYWPGNQAVQSKIEEVCRMLSRLIQTTLDTF